MLNCIDLFKGLRGQLNEWHKTSGEFNKQCDEFYTTFAKFYR